MTNLSNKEIKMKKILLYSLLGATALFNAACDEDFNEDVVPPQEWNQEEAIQIPSFKAEGVENLDLNKIEGDSVVAIKTTCDVSLLPEGSTIGNYRVTFTADKEDAKAVTIKASNNCNMAIKDLQAMIENDYGKRPEIHKYNAVVYANIITNGQASLLKSETSLSVSPKVPFIDTKYYLIGDMVGWTQEQMIPLNHSNKDVYSDPLFTIIFTTTKDNQCWKIIPENNIKRGNIWIEDAQGVVGVEKDGDTSLKGQLVAKPKVGAGKIEKAGMYRMNLNMMDYTYSITQIAPEYYLVGDFKGWGNNAETDMTCTLYPKDAMHQSFTTKHSGNGNIKVWLGSEFGDWAKIMGTEIDGDNSLTGSFKINGGAIQCPEPNVYYTFNADFSTNTYEWIKLDNQEPTEYEKIGLIGIGNDWNNDKFMSQVAPHNWYYKGLDVEKDTEGKFRADGKWDVDWGGNINIADSNSGQSQKKGPNMKIPAGTYNVFFNDITGEFVFKKL